jgi:hypothetical protein
VGVFSGLPSPTTRQGSGGGPSPHFNRGRDNLRATGSSPSCWPPSKKQPPTNPAPSTSTTVSQADPTMHQHPEVTHPPKFNDNRDILEHGCGRHDDGHERELASKVVHDLLSL